MGEWWRKPFLSIDTETTGVNIAEDRIVELATAVVNPDGSIESQWSTIVACGVDVPEGATEVHGITSARCDAEGMAPEAAVRRVARYMRTMSDLPVVVYNATFDVPLLLHEAGRHGVEFPSVPLVLDPLVLDKALDRYRRGSRKLVDTARHYGVDLADEDAHGALADATAAGQLMHAMVAAYSDLRSMTLTQLFVWQSIQQEIQRASFVDYVRTRKDPSFDKPGGWPLPAGLAA